MAQMAIVVTLHRRVAVRVSSKTISMPTVCRESRTVAAIRVQAWPRRHDVATTIQHTMPMAPPHPAVSATSPAILVLQEIVVAVHGDDANDHIEQGDRRVAQAHQPGRGADATGKLRPVDADGLWAYWDKGAWLSPAAAAARELIARAGAMGSRVAAVAGVSIRRFRDGAAYCDGALHCPVAGAAALDRCHGGRLAGGWRVAAAAPCRLGSSPPVAAA